MDVNDNACPQDERGALEFIASMLAPTGITVLTMIVLAPHWSMDPFGSGRVLRHFIGALKQQSLVIYSSSQ
ncbi:hypothetical protein [Pseudomonas sp. IT-194MI4]|uniref:hypothetical protein n=1 Tax=Pseudomonas sp. IT-194MI4 TaxID=3026443 RepID=UPI0039E1FCF8